ncbi:MAG: helix-turn-helix transcriptional regulator [Caldilineaceae bacterium]
MQKRKLEAHLPLKRAEFHILLALAGGEQHGYGIMQEVDALTDGAVQLGPGTLYTTIKRLVEVGWIVEADNRPDAALDDQRRRYYRLTDFGQRVAVAEAQRLAQLVDVARARRLLEQSI